MIEDRGGYTNSAQFMHKKSSFQRLKHYNLVGCPVISRLLAGVLRTRPLMQRVSPSSSAPKDLRNRELSEIKAYTVTQIQSRCRAAMTFKEQPYFSHEALDRSEDSFRLCRLLPGAGEEPVHCELIDDTVTNQTAQYCALSSTWGRPTEQRWINLTENQPNLLAALKAVRKHETMRLMWIDAICINKLENSERTHQVSLMGKIYMNTEDSDLLFDHVQKGSYKAGSENEHEGGQDPEWQYAIQGLNSLGRRPY
jgi:hypothetical protein